MNDFFLVNTSRTRLALYCIVLTLAIISLLYKLVGDDDVTGIFGLYTSFPLPWRFDSTKDALNFSLTADQCDTAFPNLYKEIDNAVARRRWNHISMSDLTGYNETDGIVRILIWDEQLYIIGDIPQGRWRSRVYSTLSMLNHALASSLDRSRLPNVEAVISMGDYNATEAQPIWAYSRDRKERDTWLMPDFGFDTLSEPGIETYSQVRMRMVEIERNYRTLDDKIQKLIWRGAIPRHFSDPRWPKGLNNTVNKSWAEVGKLARKTIDDGSTYRVPIEEHCKYAFIANTEGPGRLKYIQNCKSVIVTHEQRRIQHHQHLMVHDGQNQNYVRVRGDFSDLSEKMGRLIASPDLAKRIAQNNVEVFRDRYLTPAAEACYWRRLVRGWAEVSFRPEFYNGQGKDRKWRGVPFESYFGRKVATWKL